jgi:positive regulator of sigma E activity
MKNLWKRIQAWCSRQRISLERWEQVRVKGKTRFVFRSALITTLVLLVTLGITDYLFDEGFQFSRLLFWIVLSAIGGILIGFVEWRDMERKYKDACLEARIKASSPN